MRLTPEERMGIITALTRFLSGISAELRLYGSRTDDARKGGDIDLVLISDFADDLDKYQMLGQIYLQIGEQKIDFSIITPKEFFEDPFWRSIAEHSLVLHNW